MNSNKNVTTKNDTVALLGINSKGLVVNPAVKTNDMINFCLNAVMALTAQSPVEDVERLLKAALATRSPEAVFGTKEELEAQLEAENAAIGTDAVNDEVDAEIIDLKERVAKHIEEDN